MRGFAIFLVAGCGFTVNGGGGGNAIDGRIDSPRDSVDPLCSSWPQPPTGVDPCALAPTGPLDLCTAGTFVLDTATGSVVGQPGLATVLDTAPDPHVRVVAVDRLRVCSGATLRITGPHPIAFVVHGDAEIMGTIDVSAHDLGGGTWQPGPGGDVECDVGNGAAAITSSGGAGGGGGGGFGANGGTGGTSEGAGGARGVAEGGLSPLRGGCRGGTGGDGDNSGSGGTRGNGGGAIQIAVRGTLTSSGTIRAAGGPGLGGEDNDAGGGGGGSGGAILLEANALRLTAGAVCANGGGGGGGANDQGGTGSDGALGTCSLSAAIGGAGAPSNGQRGGNGGFGVTPAQNGVGADEGAGGGGGGVGRIRLTGTSQMIGSGVIVTPPAM